MKKLNAKSIEIEEKIEKTIIEIKKTLRLLKSLPPSTKINDIQDKATKKLIVSYLSSNF